MLEKLSKLGTTLTKAELKTIDGSRRMEFNSNPGGACSATNLCPVGQWCICDDNDCTSGKCEYT